MRCGASLMNDNSLSVALCTFNGAAFLPQLLRSVASQTRRPDELVVCDDGSTDGTRELLRDLPSWFPAPVTILSTPTKF